MNTLLIILAIYVVGFFLSLLFLIKYASKFELDGYDKEKTYATMDDYSSNASAYTAFSTVWPIFYLIGIFVLLSRGIVMFTQYIINKI
jgi:hypothetical protein